MMNEQTTTVDRTEGMTRDGGRQDTRVVSRRTVLLATAGAGVSLAASRGVRAQEAPTLRVEFTDSSIDVGDTTEVTLSISEIPNGLSGMIDDVNVNDADVATIEGASFPDGWGMTDAEVSDDGSSVFLKAADTEGDFTEGDTDVELVTLELEGQSDGEVELEFGDQLVEAADASYYDFEAESSSLTVGDGEDSSPFPAAGVGTAIAGLAGGVGYLLRKRSRQE